jgi:hypothetical protein
MIKTELFTRATIDQLSWPETADGDYARRYLLPLVQNGPQAYIRNVHNTEMMVAKVGEAILPITLTDFHPENTFTCSPYSHYITYGGFEEVERIKNPPVETLIKLALHPLAAYLRRSGFDRVVYINNWLLSTNLYPRLSPEQIQTLIAALPTWFPDRTIVFRSVDSFFNPGLYQTLLDSRYQMVLSRQIWSQEPQAAFRKNDTKSDLRLLHNTPYEVVPGCQLNDSDLRRALELYKFLYLDKYSPYNPQFTEAFLCLCRDETLLHLQALRLDGQVNAILGFFIRNGTMTTPLFGYDTRLPQSEGLYRMLSVLLLQEGQQRGLMVHASAGVGKFKKTRGGQPTIEYNAVFNRHLPISRRLPWALVKRITDAAIPAFRKNDW